MSKTPYIPLRKLADMPKQSDPLLAKKQQDVKKLRYQDQQAAKQKLKEK
jgi:hypothetical protein